MSNLLNIAIFLPVVIATLITFLKLPYSKMIAISTAMVNIIVILYLWFAFNIHSDEFQFTTNIPIIMQYGINYYIGIDGISLIFILLSGILAFVSIVLIDNKNEKRYYLASILLLEGLLIGVFSSLDIILFYTFWELTLIPTLYIIGVWGNKNRIYAAVKFFIYTLSSSLVMLLGILYLAYVHYSVIGVWSFNLIDLYSNSLYIQTQKIMFWMFMAGIAVKIPLFPLHTWLPSTYQQSPTAGLVMIAGVSSKMGVYALIRLVLPLFPDASIEFINIISVICVIMVIYGAMIAFAQNNIKQIIAYSSISHMGIVVLGIMSMNIEGMSGSVLFMFAHGITSAGLFIIIGILIDKTGEYNINTFGGLAKSIPKCTILFSIFLMGSISLPLTIGFAGEFLVLLGYFKTNKLLAIVAGTSIILVAIYMLNLFKKLFLGEPKIITEDVNRNELIATIPLAIIVIWFGIYPNIVLNHSEESIKNVIKTMYQNCISYENRKVIM